MQKLILFLSFVFLLASCSQHDRKDTEKRADRDESYTRVEGFLKYKAPLNGYDVTLCLKQLFADCPTNFIITVFLKKGDTEMSENIPSWFNLERFLSEEECLKILNGDTVVIHNTHRELGQPFFDCHNLVYFEDIDLDSKDELVICNSPCQERTSEFLDCESFYVYDVYSNFLYRNNNRFTRKISEPICRTEYIVDKTNKSVTLTGYDAASYYTKEVYWFRKGQPYKLDYFIVDGDKKDEFHWMIDDIDSAIDSITLSRFYLNP